MKHAPDVNLDSGKLRKMSIVELTNIADSMATKLQWWHSTGKNIEHPERYRRLASELYHVSEIIDYKYELDRVKKRNRKMKFKNNNG